MEARLTLERKLLDLLADGSVWRMRDLDAKGVTAATVRRSHANGAIVQVSRGAYRITNAPLVPFEVLAEAACRMPKGVVCLLSAADYHGMGDVSPAKVWMALPISVKAPKLEWPPVRPVWWRNPAAFEIGIEERQISGVTVRMTGAARTVVDMMRMSSTVGEERAVDAFHDFVRGGGSPNEVAAIAESFGIRKVVAPYVLAFSRMSA